MTGLRALLAALLALASLARLPALLALDDGGGTGKDDDDSDDDGDGGDDDGDESDDGDGDGDDDGDADPPRTFSQADLDAAIDKRLARERRKHERELAKLRKKDDAGKGDGEADAKAEQRITAAQGRVVKTEAKAAALAAGVDPKRVARFLRLVDLDDPGEFLGDDDEPDEDAIAAAVEEALEDVPEFKAASGDDDGDGKKRSKSGADGMNGDGGKKKTWTRTEIAALSDDAYERNRESIEAAVREGRVTG